MSAPTAEDVIAQAIWFQDQPERNTRLILEALAAAGYAVVPVREITELRDQVNAYACDLRAISAVARRQGEIIAAARETKA
jgi:hypothetical protein